MTLVVIAHMYIRHVGPSNTMVGQGITWAWLIITAVGRAENLQVDATAPIREVPLWGSAMR